jgi:hypothetical protein
MSFVRALPGEHLQLQFGTHGEHSKPIEREGDDTEDNDVDDIEGYDDAAANADWAEMHKSFVSSWRNLTDEINENLTTQRVETHYNGVEKPTTTEDLAQNNREARATSDASISQIKTYTTQLMVEINEYFHESRRLYNTQIRHIRRKFKTTDTLDSEQAINARKLVAAEFTASQYLLRQKRTMVNEKRIKMEDAVPSPRHTHS